MVKTISAIKARQNLGLVMNEVALKEDEYIVERAGKPLVAIISIDQYESMKRERAEFFEMVAEIQQEARKTVDGRVDAEIGEAVQSYRQKRARKPTKLRQC